MEENSPVRDTKNLWALHSTVKCSLYGCTPCIYKILIQAPKVIDGIRLIPACRPNQRPEACPRLRDNKSKGYSDGLYCGGQKVLIVGDGDFSFSLSMATGLCKSITDSKECSLMATSYQAIKYLGTIYPEVEQNVESLKKMGVHVEHQVDATKLTTDDRFKNKEFDRIIFNFPCVDVPDGQDGQHEQLEANQELIRDFLREAGSLLANEGEIHIVHKTKDPFSWWKIPELAQSSKGCKVSFKRSVVFDRSVFPEYKPRKVNDKKSFPTFDAVTHIFSSSKDMDPEGNTNGDAATELDDEPLSLEMLKNHQNVIKLTPKRMRQLTCMLQLPKRKERKERKHDFANAPKQKPNKKRRKGKKRR